MGGISSIQDVVDNQLCTGCGTCVGLCPKDALRMVIDEKKGIYIPEQDKGLCSSCGICFRVCPGYEVDFEKLNNEIFGKQPEDVLLGNFLNCYTGYAKNTDIRYNSSSGGLITALLVHALEQGIINGALVTRMKKDNPLEPEPCIARTREEIIDARGSKYCPVPVNAGLKEILRSNDGEVFAVVGLPCHIHGIRKAQMVNRSVAKKIIMCLGIMCARTDNFHFIQSILKANSIPVEKVKNIRYRGEGWPGYLVIDMKDAGTKKIFYEQYIPAHLMQTFTPARCNVCIDAVNQLSDTSYCDAWGIVEEDTEGSSVTVIRTERGNDVSEKCCDRAFCLEQIDSEKLMNTQGIFSRSRISLKMVNINLNRIFFRKNPMYPASVQSDYSPTMTEYLMQSFLRFQNIFLSREMLWTLTWAVTKMEYNSIQKRRSRR
jgi:coenzyme F420 hydrogenase subunit beta